MLKQNTKKNRKGMTYDLTSIEERKKIMELKSQGVKPKQIAAIMNKNLKSIESIRRIERKSQYKEFKQKMIQQGLSICKNYIKYDMTNKKKIAKKVRVIINQILNHSDKDEFRLLIPKSRQSSNQRRIKDSIVQIIVSNLLSNNYTSDRNQQQIHNQNEADTQNFNQILEEQKKTYQNQEFSQYEIDSDNQQDHFNIDLITPQYQDLNEKKIIFFQNYQRFSKINLLEDLTTTQENNNQKFEQFVDQSSKDTIFKYD